MESILLSFGGEDPNNMTLRFLNLLIRCHFLENINLKVITGPAYIFHDELIMFINSVENRSIELIHNVKDNMHEIMLSSDIAIVSNGRTVYELAALGIPSISISANNREDSHNFSTIAGFFKLGLNSEVSDNDFIDTIVKILDYNKRLEIHKRSISLDLKNGKNRIKGLIEEVLTC
ncbi:hypothetical protein PXH59_18885 [Xenorhabdus sp. SF857]|uniref:hypothetical protein n=1 Tax=Xenorhabdus bakwenae TaxID=3026967 RepID=UPI002558208E|nr:hypothetical protein [Xenorhabdus sp. SF857]WFQ79585.1 hypothetical protein PXH59_18885 [Xenorhabdus sp. SF857]